MNEKNNIILFDIINFLTWTVIILLLLYLIRYEKNERINIMFSVLIIIIFVMLFVAIINMSYLINLDNELLNKNFIFSTKLLNDEINLMTYPQKSILNLNQINYIYDIKQNHIINYNNISNKYNFKVNNKIYTSERISFNINYFNQYFKFYEEYFNKIGLIYDENNKIYSFNENNITKYIVINFNDKWLLLEFDNDKYKPLYYLYYSYIYSYYRLCDIDDNCICKFNTIGPENLHDLSINRYYTIYGNYIDNWDKNNLKLILSLLLPLTFTTKLKMINYKNNLK
jgi:hypothetical protein